MSKYYFHIRDGWDLIPDDEGMEFPSLNMAEVEANASARDLSAAAIKEGRTCAASAVEVADASGNVLCRVKVEPVYRVA